MAIFHLHVKNISRRFGRSAVAAAAYRAGQTLPNEAEERDSKFGGRRDVIHTEIMLPEGAPAWMGDRAALWNAAEAAEKRKDARLAKEIEVALPRELPRAAWVLLGRRLGDTYRRRGHVVDLAIHEDGLNINPHAHVLLTTRRADREGFGPKLREADAQAFVAEARAIWAQLANEALGQSGAGISVDPRSHQARGLSTPPSVHKGIDRQYRAAKRELAHAERVGRMSQVDIDEKHTKPACDQRVADEPRAPSEQWWGQPTDQANSAEPKRGEAAEGRQDDERLAVSQRLEAGLARLEARLLSQGATVDTEIREELTALRAAAAEVVQLEAEAGRSEALLPVPDEQGRLVPAGEDWWKAKGAQGERNLPNPEAEKERGPGR